MSGSRRYVSPMLAGAEFTADVVLVAPREFEVTRAQRTYREKNFTSFTDLLNQGAFQAQHIQRINEALGLEALATYLREAGLSVAVINCNVAPHTPDEVARKVVAARARIVGISLIYRPQVGYALELIEALKAAPDVRVAVGGALASFMPRELLSRLARLDAVVFGEAEETFCDYCLSVVGGNDPRSLPGIAFRDGDSTVMNPAAAPLDLRTIRRPSRYSLEYLRARSWPTRIASIYTSRGCMAKCTFCTGKDAYNVERPITYRYRDPIDVVDEIHYLHDAFGVKFVYINDDNFLGYGRKSLDRVRAFAEELMSRRLGVEFATECRVDAIDLDILRLLRQAGMRQVLLGVESGSDPVLTRWRKGVTVEHNRRAVALCREAGVTLEPGFILFDAETTKSELTDNLQFIRDAQLDRVPFPTYLINRMSVYPGTEVEREWTEKGILRPSPILTQRTACPTDRNWTQLWRSGAVARDAAVPYHGDFVDDPSAVVDYFQRLEYRCAQPQTEIAWRGLRRSAEPIEEFLESRLPALISILSDCRHFEAETSLRDEIHELIARAARWRRGIGALIVSMLESTIRSYDYGRPLQQLRWLRRTLAAARQSYEAETLGMSCDAFCARVMEVRRQLMPMRASVVLAAPGRDWSRLRRTLTALGRQRVPDGVSWEVVLVHDAVDQPDWRPLLGGVAIQMIQVEQGTRWAAACNRGVQAARGETVVVIGDDVAPQGFLTSHLEAQTRRPTLCYSPVRELPQLPPNGSLDELVADTAAPADSGGSVTAIVRALDDVTACTDRYGRSTRFAVDGIESLDKGWMDSAWLAFAAGNFSSPRRWLLADPFDEHAGEGFERPHLAFQWWRKHRPLALADGAPALRMGRAVGQLTAGALIGLPWSIATAVVNYQSGDAGIGEVERAVIAEHGAALIAGPDVVACAQPLL